MSNVVCKKDQIVLAAHRFDGLEFCGEVNAVLTIADGKIEEVRVIDCVSSPDPEGEFQFPS